MGCIHSAVIRKGANQGTSMDHNPHTDPSVSPGILQLAGVGSPERSFFVSQLLAVGESALVG